MKKPTIKKIQPKKPSDEEELITYLNPDNVLEKLRIKNPDLWKRINADTPEGELAKVLLAWRLLNNRTQEAQAGLAGCSRASYINMEGAKHGANPGYLTLYRMAKSYGLSIQDFMVGPGKAGRLST